MALYIVEPVGSNRPPIEQAARNPKDAARKWARSRNLADTTEVRVYRSWNHFEAGILADQKRDAHVSLVGLRRSNTERIQRRLNHYVRSSKAYMEETA